MSVELIVHKITFGAFVRTGLNLKFSEKDRTISLETIEDGFRTKMLFRSWDVSRIDFNRDATQIYYPHGKTTIVFELLTPPSFSMWAKEIGAKNNKWLPCVDYTKGQALEQREFSLLMEDPDACTLLWSFHRMDAKRDIDSTTHYDRRIVSGVGSIYWHAFSSFGDIVRSQSAPANEVTETKQVCSKRKMSLSMLLNPIKRTKSELRAVPVIEEEQDAKVFQLFEFLPNELVFTILNYLDVNSLCALSVTNRYFNCLARSDMFWKSLSESQFEVTVLPEKTMNWFTTYKVMKRIRCVHCGKRGRMIIRDVLMRIVLCASCKNLPQYEILSLTTAMKKYQIRRECMTAVRRVTVPTFKGLHMRFFLGSDVKSYVGFSRWLANKENHPWEPKDTSAHSVVNNPNYICK